MAEFILISRNTLGRFVPTILLPRGYSAVFHTSQNWWFETRMNLTSNTHRTISGGVFSQVQQLTVPYQNKTRSCKTALIVVANGGLQAFHTSDSVVLHDSPT